MTAQTFNPIAELSIPTVTSINEVNVEIETQPVTYEVETGKCSYFKYPYLFILFTHALNHYALFLLRDNFLFYLFFSV